MRFLQPVLLVLLISTSLNAFEIVRILPEYKTDKDFERISEYFSGKENNSGSIMLRSQDASRDGYYFTTRVKTETDLRNTVVELEIIQSDNPRNVRKYMFQTDLPKGSHLLNIGVTGSDWSSTPRQRPVAWRLVFLDATGNVLASEQSYLWEKPAGER